MEKGKKKRHLTGSLVRRVVFICLALLVIPLFLYNVFLDEQESQKDVAYRFLILLICIAFFGGTIVWILVRKIAVPLRSLSKTMQRVSEGGVHVRYVPKLWGFEINALGEQFNETMDSLLRAQALVEKEKLEREKLAEELRIGHEIQKSLLPTHLPALGQLGVATGYLPAKEVGGDFYDLFLLDPKTAFLSIADTAGKGVSACLYSLGVRSSMRSFASVSQDLGDIVLKTNDLFWVDAKNTGMFVTLWAAMYDVENRRLTYCNQGHTPTLLIRQGKIEELTTGGIALGAQKWEVCSVGHVHLEKDDLLVLYTDGVIETHNPDQELFGKERFQEFLLRHKKLSPEKIVHHLLKEIEMFGQGSVQHDDVTVVIIRIF